MSVTVNMFSFVGCDDV